MTGALYVRIPQSWTPHSRRFQDLLQRASLEPPFATSLDLYRELKAVTPDSLRTLLGDLLERNTFWELKASAAKARLFARGAWEVSLDVVARKVAVDPLGVETELPMDDPIEIGIYAPAKPGDKEGAQFHLAMHRIRTGPQTITITITVPGRPALAGIDPRHLLIDVAPDNNLIDVAGAALSTR